MNEAQALTRIDYLTVLIAVFTILSFIRICFSLWDFYKKRWRLKTGNELDKENIETRFTNLETRLLILEKHDNWQYQEITKISKGIEDIQEELLNKNIKDMRKTILDFCSSLSSGQNPNKEAFDFIFKVHEDYNNILEKHHRENNVINESMKFISEKYQELLHK